MSSKINVSSIISGHLNTLKDARSGKLSLSDRFTFFIFPFFLAGVCIYFGYEINDQVTSLLVNFGAIFTALLLSVLVLVYDQGTKIAEKIHSPDASQVDHLKQDLMDELYFNICYAIVLSVALVFFCLVEKVIRGLSIPFNFDDFNLVLDIDIWLNTPIVVWLTVHLMLNILMIVKRMHVLLTTK